MDYVKLMEQSAIRMEQDFNLMFSKLPWYCRPFSRLIRMIFACGFYAGSAFGIEASAEFVRKAS